MIFPSKRIILSEKVLPKFSYPAKDVVDEVELQKYGNGMMIKYDGYEKIVCHLIVVNELDTSAGTLSLYS